MLKSLIQELRTPEKSHSEHFAIKLHVDKVVEHLKILEEATKSRDRKSELAKVRNKLYHTMNNEYVECENKYRDSKKLNAAKIRETEYFNLLEALLKQLESDLYGVI